MTRKVLRLLVPVSFGVVIVALWPEIVRYFKIERISSGHPELVPAGGRHGYPERSHGVGHTDEFDSGARGGPELREAGGSA